MLIRWTYSERYICSLCLPNSILRLYPSQRQSEVRCGVSFETICPFYTPSLRLCCSSIGYCGTTEEHCGAGCQADYGHCNWLQCKCVYIYNYNYYSVLSCMRVVNYLLLWTIYMYTTFFVLHEWRLNIDVHAITDSSACTTSAYYFVYIHAFFPFNAGHAGVNWLRALPRLSAIHACSHPRYRLHVMP